MLEMERIRRMYIVRIGPECITYVYAPFWWAAREHSILASSQQQLSYNFGVCNTHLSNM